MTKKTCVTAILAIAAFAFYPGTVVGRVSGALHLPASALSHPRRVGRTPLAAGAQAGELELGYDSGPELFAPDDDVVSAEWSVRYTPPQACSLAYLQIVTFQQPGPLAVTVYSDDGSGLPGAVISGPYQLNATGDLSYQRVDFPTPIDVGNSDFHIGIGILQSQTPHPTFDGDGGTLRTSYRRDSAPWGSVENLDMVMSAFVRPYGSDAIAPTLYHIPSAVAFAGDGPVDIAARASDLSGIQSATVHYSSDGVSYQSAALSEAAGLFTGAIPMFPTGSTVRYYLSAVDNSPAKNAAILPAAGAGDPFSYIVLPGTELRFDDGLPEEFWIESDVYDGNAFGVYMTPTSYPAIVSHLRVLVDDTTSFILAVQQGGTGVPGDVIGGPFVVSADSVSGWVDVFIPEAERPTISTGGFYVVMYWYPQSPGSPGVAADLTTLNNRSLWYDNGFGWNSYNDANWIMRAAVQTPTGIVEELGGSTQPAEWHLAQNAPNPFNPSTVIRFSLTTPSDVALDIHNILGQLVRRLTTGHFEAGDYAFEWDGRDRTGQTVNTGVYLYTLRTDRYSETRKMLLLK